MAVPSNFFDAFMPPAGPVPRRRRAEEELLASLEPRETPIPPTPSVEPPPAAEPEGPGVMSTLGHAALSGLGIVGNAFDLFPSMLRDIATLDNPLDQLLTPISDENRNTGRDVLTKWGATKENDPDEWELADLAGFGVDVLSGLPMGGLSLGGKAATVGGQIAKKAGFLDDLARVAPTVGSREAKMTHTLGDLLRTRADEAIPMPGTYPMPGPAAAAATETAQTAAETAAKGASTPFMITQKMRAALKQAGHSEDQIRQMTPQQAWDVLNKAPDVPPPQAAVIPPEPRVHVDGPTMSVSRGRAAAEAAKEMGVNLDDVLDEPLGGLLGVGNPFGPVKKVYGTGERAQQVARAMDTVGSTLKKSAPVRLARQLFDHSVKGKGDQWAQDIAEQATKLETPAKAKAREMAHDFGEKMDELNAKFDAELGDAAKAVGGTGGTIGDFAAGQVVHAADRNNYGWVVGPGAKGGAQVRFISPENGASTIVELPLDQISKVGGTIADDVARRATSDAMNQVLQMSAERGGDVAEAVGRVLGPGAAASDELAEGIRSAGDHMQTANKAIFDAVKAKGGNAKGIYDQALVEGISEYLPRATYEGTSRILKTKNASMIPRDLEVANMPARIVNEILTDPAARGEDAAEYIFNKYRPFLNPNYAGGEGDDLAKHSEALAEWMKGRPAKAMYRSDQLDAFSRYQLGMQTTSRVLDAVHDTIRRTIADEGIPLKEAFARAGMEPDQAMRHLSSLTGITTDVLKKKALPDDVVRGITAVLKPGQSSEWAQRVGGIIDKYTQTFKDWVTLPFPAFWVRNFEGGQISNIVSGDVQSLGDLSLYGRTLGETFKMMRGGKLPKDLERELRIHNVMPQHGFMDTSVLHRGNQLTPNDPLAVKRTWQTAGEQTQAPQLADKIPGVRTSRQAGRAAKLVGSDFNESVEFLNRTVMYRYLRKKGHSPEAAAKRVAELQFDYSKLAPAERDVMKRMMPFYSFTRFAMPLVFNTLRQQPGGPLAQIIRLSSQQTSDEPVPGYISSSTSIPLGTRETGDKAFLTGMGMMHEDPLKFLGGGVRGAGMEILSRTNPLFKAPLEWATGQSFFQHGADGGRSLDDLDPPIGRTLANIAGDDEAYDFPGRPIEFLASATPLSRFITSARTLTDRRKTLLDKAFNLGTGLRISDVSPAASDREMRNRAFQLMKQLGARSFQDVYFSKEQLAEMAPEQRAAADEVRELTKTLDERAKQRKAAKLLALGSLD